MRELAIVLPGDVWLTDLSERRARALRSPGGGGSSMRSSIGGPALELSGCASGQDAVAGFVQSLKQIDGVTRVGVESSAARRRHEWLGLERQRRLTKSSFAQFQMVVAFDAAPVASEESESKSAGAPATESSSSETTTASLQIGIGKQLR